MQESHLEDACDGPEAARQFAGDNEPSLDG
jgi:hypothetical protein